jgi:CBS domain-containing protein
MKIRDLQPRGAVTIADNASLKEAAHLMVEEDIGALPVFGGRGLVGIFSERDLIRAVVDEVDLEEEEVEGYMTESPLRVDIDSFVADAIDKMREFNVRHLVVADGDDVTGVISMRDLFYVMGAPSQLVAPAGV